VKIIILTGSELRHDFFRKFIGLSPEIKIIYSYCEGLEKSLRSHVDKDNKTNDFRSLHLCAREQSEKDFFSLFVENALDQSNPTFLPKGEINNPKHTKTIIDCNPDLLIAYGCSIIKEPLLSAFKRRILNVHLGLSPYYRGSGTNYWPLVNKEPEYVGATFMYLDAGIDTGEIIHQIRAKYCWGDMPSQIGNRLICEMSRVFRDIIINFNRLSKMSSLPEPTVVKVYKVSDFSEESVVKLYKQFKDGMIENYLNEEKKKCDRIPIVRNPVIVE
jgi:phosphoribosylglycinamide formyltransferase 1